jgi:hypothetical protein
MSFYGGRSLPCISTRPDRDRADGQGVHLLKFDSDLYNLTVEVPETVGLDSTEHRREPPESLNSLIQTETSLSYR